MQQIAVRGVQLDRVNAKPRGAQRSLDESIANFIHPRAA